MGQVPWTNNIEKKSETDAFQDIFKTQLKNVLKMYLLHQFWYKFNVNCTSFKSY